MRTISISILAVLLVGVVAGCGDDGVALDPGTESQLSILREQRQDAWDSDKSSLSLVFGSEAIARPDLQTTEEEKEFDAIVLGRSFALAKASESLARNVYGLARKEYPELRGVTYQELTAAEDAAGDTRDEWMEARKEASQKTWGEDVSWWDWIRVNAL